LRSEIAARPIVIALSRRRDRLAEAEAAVDDCNDRRIHQAFDRLIRDDIARTHPIDIARHSNDAVTVVAAQIGVDERGGDAAHFLRAAADMFEDLGAEVCERIGSNMDRHLVALACPPPR
jgi:hypothetical protein